MDEEQQKETTQDQEQDSEEDNSAGNKSTKTGILNEAYKVNKELGEKIQQLNEIVEWAEQLTADNLLRGRSDANMDNKPKEETPREYKDRILGKK